MSLFGGKKSHFSIDDFDFPIFGALNCFSKKISFLSLNVKLVDMLVKQAVV